MSVSSNQPLSTTPSSSPWLFPLLQSILPQQTNEGTLLPILWFIVLPLIVAFAIMMLLTNRRKNSSNKSNDMPIMNHTPQGSAYPLLGHGLTFWRHTPWDLLATWHQKANGSFASSGSNRVSTAVASSTEPFNNTNGNSDSISDQSSSNYHPIISFPLLGTTYFSVASPSLCKAVLQTYAGSHVVKDVAVTMRPFLSILGTGMVSSDGSHWLTQRLHVSHALRRDILCDIPALTLRAVQRLCRDTLDPAQVAASTSNESTTTTAVPIGSLLRHLTLQVISSAFLSLSATESDETFAQLYLPIVEECNIRVWHPYRTYAICLPSFWRHCYNVHRLNTYVSALIVTRWTLRRREEQQQHGGNTTITSDTPSRRRDILDTVLQAYEDKKRAALSSALSISSSLSSKLADATTVPPAPMLPPDTSLSTAEICQVRDEMKTFMLAGHETSAAMMTWTLYELMLSEANDKRLNDNAATTDQGGDPRSDYDGSSASSSTSQTWMDQVLTEANAVFENVKLIDEWPELAGGDGVNGGDKSPPRRRAEIPSPERLAELVLAEASLKESLRKYNVVPTVARRVVKDLHLDDAADDQHHKRYFLPRGSSILVNMQSVHHNPEIWPRPMQYNPTRFLASDGSRRSSDGNVANGSHDGTKAQSTTTTATSSSINSIAPFTYLPFIAGPRNCLGQHLALLESKMVIALLVQRYKFSLAVPTTTTTTTSSGNHDAIDPEDWSGPNNDPRHRFMVPIIPKEELMVTVTRR